MSATARTVATDRWRLGGRATSLPGDLVAVLGLAALTAASYADVLRGSRSILVGDNSVQSFAWYRFSAHWLARGVLPLWDPTQLGGHTFVGEGQAGLFYPPNLVVFALAGDHLSTRVVSIYMLAHVLLAALGEYALLRVLRLGPLPAAIGAIAFAFGGFVAGRLLGQTNIFVGAAWLPLALLVFVLALERTALLAPLAGVPLALSFLGGHIQPPAFTLLTLVAFAAWWGAARPARGSRLLRTLVVLLTTVVVAGLVSAVQLLPSLEYQARALRWVGAAHPVPASEKLPYSFVSSHYIVPPRALAGLFSPAYGALEDATLYMGVVTLVLAAYGLLRAHRRTAFWAILGAIALLYSLGRYGGVYHVAYVTVPFIDKVREPDRALLVVDFCLAATAAIGAARLLDGDVRPAARPRTHRVVLGAIAVAAALAVWRALDGLDGTSRGASIVTALVLVVLVAAVIGARHVRAVGGRAAVALCLCALVLDLVPPLVSRIPHASAPSAAGRYYATTPVVRFLAAHGRRYRTEDLAGALPPNAGNVFSFPMLMGHAATMDEHYFRYRSLAWLPPSREHDLLAVRYVVSPRPVRGYPRAFGSGSAAVYENPSALPLARLVADWRHVASRRAAMTLPLSRAFPYRRAVAVETRPAAAGPRMTAGRVRVVHASPDRVEYRTRSNGGALLVAADTWYPGWHASVDGRRAPVLRADGMLRAVAVPAGDHRVVMTYRPTRWALALVLLALGLVVVAASTVGAGVRLSRG